MKMPKKLKAKWLKALRSGEYGQCGGTLTDGKGNFCCLGVLQHVASGGSCEVGDAKDSDFLSMPSQDWYAKNGIIHDDKHHIESQLICMNDGSVDFDEIANNTHVRGTDAKSFKQIAKYIEQNVETY